MVFEQAKVDRRRNRASSYSYICVRMLKVHVLYDCEACAVQESAWLKRKLSENNYTFSHRLDASARYIASKAPVLPTHGLRAVHTAVSASVSVSVSLSVSFVLACVCICCLSACICFSVQ
jgi:hypothetical protein